MSNVTWRDLVNAARFVYQQQGGECGGNLHVVLDDGNLDDNDILFCLAEAMKEGDKQKRVAEMLCAVQWLSASEAQRELAYTNYDEYAL